MSGGPPGWTRPRWASGHVAGHGPSTRSTSHGGRGFATERAALLPATAGQPITAIAALVFGVCSFLLVTIPFAVLFAVVASPGPVTGHGASPGPNPCAGSVPAGEVGSPASITRVPASPPADRRLPTRAWPSANQPVSVQRPVHGSATGPVGPYVDPGALRPGADATARRHRGGRRRRRERRDGDPRPGVLALAASVLSATG